MSEPHHDLLGDIANALFQEVRTYSSWKSSTYPSYYRDIKGISYWYFLIGGKSYCIDQDIITIIWEDEIQRNKIVLELSDPDLLYKVIKFTTCGHIW